MSTIGQAKGLDDKDPVSATSEDSSTSGMQRSPSRMWPTAHSSQRSPVYSGWQEHSLSWNGSKLCVVGLLLSNCGVWEQEIRWRFGDLGSYERKYLYHSRGFANTTSPSFRIFCTNTERLSRTNIIGSGSAKAFQKLILWWCSLQSKSALSCFTKLEKFLFKGQIYRLYISA